MEEEEFASYPVDPQRIAAMNAASLRAGAGGVQQSPLSSPQQAPAAAAMNPYGFRDAYAKIYSDLQSQAASKSAAQQEYLASLQKQEAALGQQGMSDYDRASLLFQAAGALGQPTRSGGLGETIGNFATSMSGPLSKAAEAQRQRQSQLQQLQMARQKLGMEMAGTGGVDPGQALALLKAQQEAEIGKGAETFKREDVNGRPVLVGSRGTTRPFDYKAAGLDAAAPLAPKGVPQEVIDLGPKAVEEYVSSRAKEVAKGTATTQGQLPMVDPSVSGIPPLPPELDFSKRIKDPKQRDIWMARNRDTGSKALDKEELGVRADEDKINEMKRFIQLNTANPENTGPVAQYTYSYSNPNTEMTKIANFIAPSLRVPGTGGTSDFDAKQFLKSTVSTGNDFAVNRNIGLAYITAKQNQKDYVEFRREYLEQNGTLEGSGRQWKNYLEANSIFKEPKGKTSKDVANVELNPDRMYYRDWFKQQLSPKVVKRDSDGNLVMGGE